jgi:hypothetical protein
MQNQKLVVAAGSIASSRMANSTVDALVRARCERRRSGLEKARKWQCEMLAGAACVLQ